jgi:hypothetical protein
MFNPTGGGPPGLVAAYGFNEGSGSTVADASGNGHTGTISGATWTTAGKFGRALVFDGVNDLVSIADSNLLDLTSGMTLMAWVSPTGGLSGWRNIIKKEVDSYFLNAHTPSGGPGGGGTIGSCCPVISAGPALVLNTWTHVALTYDGSALRLYRNGTLVATQAATGTIQPSALPLRIGGDAVYGEHVQGRIDEVRIYNRALTASEIQTDMNAPVP